MDNFTATVVGGTIVAAIIALTKLSFDRPRAFNRLTLLPALFVCLAEVLTLAFQSGLRVAGIKLQEHAAPASIIGLNKLIDLCDTIEFWTGITIITLMVISFLPSVVGAGD